MNTPYSKTQNFFRGLWSVINSRIFLIILIVIAGLFIAKSCSDINILERESVIAVQNALALNDNITYIMNENDVLQASIMGYIVSKKELRKLNKDLFDEVKKQDGKIVTLNKTVIRLTQNEEELEKHINELESKFGAITPLSDNMYSVPWQLVYSYDSTNFDKLIGRTTVKATHDATNGKPIQFTNIGTKLVSRTTQIQLTFGQKVVDNKLQVYVTSPYPGFTAASLEGVLIDPNTNPYIRKLIKKKHWFTGFGLGVSATVGVNTSGIPIVVIGLGATYNIYSF
jgi:cell division protein FtsB